MFLVINMNFALIDTCRHCHLTPHQKNFWICIIIQPDAKYVQVCRQKEKKQKGDMHLREVSISLHKYHEKALAFLRSPPHSVITDILFCTVQVLFDTLVQLAGKRCAAIFL